MNINIVKVTGNSMLPVLINNREYEFIDCSYPPNINDIVICKISPNKNIIKFVKGIEFNSIQIKALNPIAKKFNILVNNEIIQNSENQNYTIIEKQKMMLDGYRFVPKNCVMVMGNLINGSLDSTKIGMIHKDQIIGKIKM